MAGFIPTGFGKVVQYDCMAKSDGGGMDEDRLKRLRERYAGTAGGHMYDPEFRNVAAAQFQGDKRKWPFADPATLLGAPFRPQAASEGFAGLDVALVGVPMDLGVTNRAGARL